MANDTIKEFLVAVGLDVDENSEKKFTSLLASATTAVAGIAAVVTTATAGLFLFTQGIAHELDDLNDLSKRINSTVGEISEFAYVAQISGSSVEIATASLDTFNKIVGDTSLGLGRAKKIFAEIGIKVKNTDGTLKDTTDLLWEVGDAIKGMEKGKQTAILQRLGLDKTLIESLTTDVSGLREEFNMLYDKDELNKSAEDAADFMDAYDRMRMGLTAIMRKIASKFFKPFEGAMIKLTKLIVEYAPQIVNAIAPIAEAVFKMAQFFITLFGRVFSIAFNAISIFLGWLTTINNATNGWLGYIAQAVLAWRILSATILASPIGMIAALGVAILALVDDFMTWKEGGDSLFDWSAWMPFFNAFGDAIDAIKLSLDSFFTILFESFGLAKELLSLNFGAALEHGKNIIGAAQNLTQGLGLSSGQALMTPSPSAAASLTAGTNVNQKTEININGAGDPKQVANNVVGGQNRVNDDMVRNMKGSAK